MRHACAKGLQGAFELASQSRCVSRTSGGSVLRFLSSGRAVLSPKASSVKSVGEEVKERASLPRAPPSVLAEGAQRNSSTSLSAFRKSSPVEEDLPSGGAESRERGFDESLRETRFAAESKAALSTNGNANVVSIDSSSEASSLLSPKLPISLLREVAAALPVRPPIKTAGEGRTKAVLLNELRTLVEKNASLGVYVQRMLEQHQRIEEREQRRKRESLSAQNSEGLSPAETVGDEDNFNHASPLPGEGSRAASPVLTKRIPLLAYLKEKGSSYAETLQQRGLPASKGRPLATNFSTKGFSDGGRPADEDSSSGEVAESEETFVHVPLDPLDSQVQADFVLIDSAQKADRVRILIEALLHRLETTPGVEGKDDVAELQQRSQEPEFNPAWQPDKGGYQQPRGLVAMGVDTETTGLDPKLHRLR